MPPNILFLLSDDQSTPHLGCYGNRDLRTPNLDRLAAGGVLFDRHFVGCPQCVPARAVMMTGRSAVAARMTRFTAPLPRDEITFPELLREQAGYFTGVFGRTFHLDGPEPPRNTRGAEPVFAAHGLRTFAQRMDVVEVSNPDLNAERFASFLDGVPAGRPFFCWVNYSDPHHPWTAREYEPDPAGLSVPGYLPDLPGVRADLAKYYGEVMRVDDHVGRLLAVLAARGLEENTVVVFMGDNGYAMPHGKGSLYDPGINTPLVVRWPGTAEAGRRSAALVSGEDLAPTLLAAAGLPPHPRMSGVSFVPLLTGAAPAVRSSIFAERGPHGATPMGPGVKANHVDFSRCLRTDRYKLIYNCSPWHAYGPVDSAGDAGWQAILAARKDGTLPEPFVRAYFTQPRPVMELFDLRGDPDELCNLAGRREVAEIEEHLTVMLQEKMILDGDYLPLPCPR